MKFLFFFITWMILLTSCDSEKERSLVWSDEFEGKGMPDTVRWNLDSGDGCPNNCGWGNNEIQFYTGDPTNVRLKDGVLIIEAHKDSVGGKPFTSAKLISRGKGDLVVRAD